MFHVRNLCTVYRSCGANVPLPPISPELCKLLSFYFLNNYLNGMEVLSHCSFDLCFPDDSWGGASFHVPVVHLCVFFGEMFMSFAHFKSGYGFLLLFCFVLLLIVGVPYVFWKLISLSGICFASISSKSTDLLFIMLFSSLWRSFLVCHSATRLLLFLLSVLSVP